MLLQISAQGHLSCHTSFFTVKRSNTMYVLNVLFLEYAGGKKTTNTKHDVY